MGVTHSPMNPQVNLHRLPKCTLKHKLCAYNTAKNNMDMYVNKCMWRCQLHIQCQEQRCQDKSGSWGEFWLVVQFQCLILLPTPLLERCSQTSKWMSTRKESPTSYHGSAKCCQGLATPSPKSNVPSKRLIMISGKIKQITTYAQRITTRLHTKIERHTKTHYWQSNLQKIH